MSNFPVSNVAIKFDSPCHHCDKRYLKCFSTCDDYAKYRNAIDTEKEKYINHFKARRDLDDYVIKEKIKRKKISIKGRYNESY